MLKKIPKSPVLRRNPLRTPRALDLGNPSQSKPAISGQSPQIPPESAAASILSPPPVSSAMRDSSAVDSIDSWQTALSRRSARGSRQSSRASRMMSGTAALTLPVISAVTSSLPPVSSEGSEITSELPISIENPLPSGSLLQRGLPASAEATSVVPTSVDSQLDSSKTEPAFAEGLLSSLTDAQRLYVANATRLAMTLSPEQLSIRSENVNEHLRFVNSSQRSPIAPPDLSEPLVDAATLRIAKRITKRNKRKLHRARLTIDELSLPASAEATSVVPGVADSQSSPTPEPAPIFIVKSAPVSNQSFDIPLPKLEGHITRRMVEDTVYALNTYQCPFTPSDCVPASARTTFLSLLQRRYHSDAVLRTECRQWPTWSVKRFCEELKDAVPAVTEAQAQIMGFIEAITRVKLNFDLQDPLLEEETDKLLSDITDAHPDASAADELAAVAILKKRLPDSPTNWRGILQRRINGQTPLLDNVEAFRFVWLQQLKLCREHIATANLMGGTFHYTSARQFSPQCSSLFSTESKKSLPVSKKRGRSDSVETPIIECTGCGRVGHEKPSCHFTASKYFNKGNGKYVQSAAFALLKKDRPKHKDLTLPRDSLLKSFPTSSSSSSTSAPTVASQNKEQALNRKGMTILSVIVNDPLVKPPDPIPNYKYFFLSLPSQKAKSFEERNRIETLIDTGSLAGNFVLRQVLIDLNLTSAITASTCPSTVCSGLDNSCYDLKHSIKLTISYFCSILNNYASFERKAFIFDKSPL